MQDKKQRLLDFFEKKGLYLVADKGALPSLPSCIDAGIDLIQYRDKESDYEAFLETAWKIKEIVKEKNVLFIINDRTGVARKIDADGVHLGQYDIAPEKARKILGKEKIIGISTHSIEQARESAKKEKDIDYISIGPIFATPAKPQYNPLGTETLEQIVKELKEKEKRIPIVAIGGINESNIKQVTATGINRVAVSRAVLSAEQPCEAARKLLQYF